MYGLATEYHRLANGKTLAEDLAEHLARNIYQGKAVIVAERPAILLATARKQWRKLERSTWKARARTVNSTRIAELSNQYFYMQHLSFTAKLPDEALEASVTFMTAEDCLRLAPDCKTLYATYDVQKEKLHMMTSWMPRSGLVVLYG